MKINRILTFSALSMFLLFGCQQSSKEKLKKSKTDSKSYSEEELYRPNFHFTPKANWMNDPNGMFFLNGKYHLYFQYYPDGNVWGPMHWGHATSKDLIEWEEQPIALYPDRLGYIFSGSAVVDKYNLSGFGTDSIQAIVAMYTYHNMTGEKNGKKDFQTQAIAYSLNEGQSFIKYNKNPVIGNSGIKDFRDPKIIWDVIHQKWVMVLAAGQEILIYSSLNLKDWKLESDFGKNIGSHGGVWECPDLFPMYIEETNELKWVLLVSINPGGPNGGSATQYFVGDFDGKNFVLDASFEEDLKSNKSIWIDYGRDNYAGVTWSNIPKSDGRKLFIGWMSNWDYARDVPTETWRSAMTIARELKLKKIGAHYKLFNFPVSELTNYVSKNIIKDSLNINEIENLVSEEDFEFSNLNIQFELENLKKESYNFLLHNKAGDTLTLGLNNMDGYFFIDRTKSGKVNFSEKFASRISKVKVNELSNSLKVRILLDKTSVEVFYNEGETAMTEIFFPNVPFTSFSIHSKDKEIKILNLKIQELQINPDKNVKY